MKKMDVQDKTMNAFDEVMERCEKVYANKNKDYGASWRMMRMTALTDQILIKALRVRNIEMGVVPEVKDGVENEMIGIINYCVMALIQQRRGVENDVQAEYTADEAMKDYKMECENTRCLLAKKNHDYNEAWRHMRQSSYTDLVIAKLKRIKQIEENQGRVIVSEGVEGGYRDIWNYAVFWLIRHWE